MALSPFHLAIPVHNLAAARHFYGETFGLAEGRSSEHWGDFDFYGHQLVIHEHPQTASQESAHTNAVDGHDVPRCRISASCWSGPSGKHWPNGCEPATRSS